MLYYLKMSNKLNSYQSTFANWLLYLTLIWSVCLFSGYVDSDYLTLPSITYTELVEPQKTVRTAVTFYKSTPKLAIQKQLPSFFFFPKTALRVYHQLQQVKFIAWTKRRNLDNFSFNFLPIKTIPSASKAAAPTLSIS